MTLTDAPRAKAPAAPPAPPAAPAPAPPADAAAPTGQVAAATGTAPQPARFTLAQYHAAIEAGVLTEQSKVELIDGRLIEKMSIGKRHRDSLDRINRYFVRRYDDPPYLCSAQNPITLPADSEPEPDYVVVNRKTYAQRATHPEPADLLLLIEVADSTLEYDRDTKAPLYAAAGIAEYWIVNVRHAQLELYTEPDAETGRYRTVRTFDVGDTFESSFCGEVAVSNLLA